VTGGDDSIINLRLFVSGCFSCSLPFLDAISVSGLTPDLLLSCSSSSPSLFHASFHDPREASASSVHSPFEVPSRSRLPLALIAIFRLTLTSCIPRLCSPSSSFPSVHHFDLVISCFLLLLPNISGFVHLFPTHSYIRSPWNLRFLEGVRAASQTITDIRPCT